MLHPNFSYNTIEILFLFISHYGRNLKPNLCQSWKKCTFITPKIISVYGWIWIWVLCIDLELYVQFLEKLWAFCILHCKFNVFFWQPFGFILCLTCILFFFCRFNVLTWWLLSCNRLCQSKPYVLKKYLKFWTSIINKKISFVFIMYNTHDSLNPTNQVSHVYYAWHGTCHFFIATKHFRKEIVLSSVNFYWITFYQLILYIYF